MRSRAALLVLAAAAAWAPRARAQTAEQPNLIFTISAGYLTGGNLWDISRQYEPVTTGTGDVWDTLNLGRKLAPGLAATLSATYFRSPHLGYNLEAGFFGIGQVSSCGAVGGYQTDPDQKNQQACVYTQGQNIRGNTVGFLAGLVYRPMSRGNQLFVRAAAGGAIIGSSFIETAAPVNVAQGGGGTGQYTLFFLTDAQTTRVTWMASLGLGAMLPISPGYQLHFEVRDLITALPVATGPVDTLSIVRGNLQPPTRWKTVHLPTITVGLDVVLERRRGRRY